ncbi:ankryin, partial [Campylobacter ureolyticus]|nr:ankryin [Campylobacter ureolyticus]
DIHCDEETNSTLIPLRKALMDKDTNKVLNFIKDNNLSADVTMLDKRTPLMYSSFYNDTNTTKELIKLGADVHKKDRYELNALAYAISINSA